MTHATIFSKTEANRSDAMETYRRLTQLTGPRSLRRIATFLAEYCHSEIYFKPHEIVKGVRVDFYCEKLRLVIEVDGFPVWRCDEVVEDLITDDYLLTWNISIFRINSKDVFDDWLDLTAHIRDAVELLRWEQNEQHGHGLRLAG